MARIVVFQHNDHESPGRLGLTLRDNGFKLDFRRPDVDGVDAIPVDLDNVQGVIVMGGQQNVTDGLPWMQAEIAFVAKAHAAQLPVVGVCLGAQVIAKALGGEVEPMDTPEVGFAPVNIVGPGQTDRITAGIRWSSPQFHTHAQQITRLPDGAALLASSEACKVQAFYAGIRTFGFQYHFELDRKQIDTLFEADAAFFDKAGVTRDQLSVQADEHYATYARLGDRLCVNIASFAFTFEELLKA
ncbi:MAG: type 1 glutamine amidotransferase [Planctomycetota bacterium]